MAQLCDALDYAHNHARIIHRDLKPANLMVNQRGDLKVSDFGIARSLGDSMSKLTMASGTSGTLVYMSPQQLDGERGTHLDDIYSLGATLYDLLTSKPPFYSGNLDKQIHERAAPSMTERRKEFNMEPAFVPPVWEETVAACLAKNPAQRPQSTAEIARRLQLAAPPAERASTISTQPSNKNALVVAGIVTLAVITLAGWYISKQSSKSAAPISKPAASQSAAITDKSIAVLPFENLSDDKDNAYFADGVQDEILTDLAKIADLKVISRMSVMPYKDAAKRNLRTIADQLGVAHVLEGSVQRIGNRVRVTAQLIDTQTDAHLWADHYDRDLADVFAIQSEIAQAIADQLHAKISPSEKAAVSQAPTSDLVANGLYAQARQLTQRLGEDYFQAVPLLDQAVARDPQFLLAWCLLGRVHLGLFFTGLDRSPARRDLANAAIEKAARLQPDAGEVHLARAQYFYYGLRDYDRARVELSLAQRTLPNDADLFFWTGSIDRRQGRWPEAFKNFERAMGLDPRNVQILLTAGETYLISRRYREASRVWERWVAIAPGDFDARLARADLPFLERADTRPLRAELSAILTEEPGAANGLSDSMFRCAMAERDSAAVDRALAAIPSEGTSPGGNFIIPREWYVGFAARVFNDAQLAQTSLTAARTLFEKLLRDQPEHAMALSFLGLVDAALGRKEEAVREGRRACELLPSSKDALLTARPITNLATIYAWTGEKDLALEQLALSAQMPNGASYGDLKLDPRWDELRGDSRYEQIVASLAPKE